MKGLSLTQPWATLVALGAKRVETRAWSTPYRGWLAIHAAKGLTAVGGLSGLVDLCQTEPYRSGLVDGALRNSLPEFVVPSNIPLGAIVAVGYLHRCGRIRQDAEGKTFLEGGSPEVVEPELSFGDYTPGRFGWAFSNVRRLPEPIPCRGALGLWAVEPQIVQTLRSVLGDQAGYVR